ncbi:glutathione S-transferase zeta class-like isoform X6 [Pyrus x bretschneideri]|uniref:glutathione S-transferase zeta class-like isoform X6 n=1 Tax=Pyrus x bretschneideri TaxID=225117 RepID=UPI00202EF215|nr:glutathione S-transferase zeta class-like isoform X6 [Pyrus x bretschneideri]
MMEAQEVEVEAQAATESGDQQLKLYSYWRSSCAYRVRIALNLKEFRKLNPLGYVPVLVDGDTLVADSFAILMAANIVSSSIQPLQNLAVLKYIEEKVSPDEKLEWVKVHIGKGFSALEELLNNHAGKYATGDEVYMADLFLAPQVYAAIRFQLDMTQFPLLARLHEAYKKIPAFLDAIPEKQPDAPSP